jgi:hypothetical protein
VRRLLVISLVVCVLSPGVAVYAVSALGAPTADATLLASVGPGMTISLTTQAGAQVTHLDPGTYDIQINDQSVEHNFRLFGTGGVNVGTEVEFVGIRTVTVTLGDGSFTYVCDVHPYDMIGQFTVGTVTTPPPPPPGGGGGSGKLVGTVGPGTTIALTKGGAKVRSLKAGKYTVTVRDRSASNDFHLKGAGVNKKTGVGYKGTQTWTVTLRSGTYSFFSTPNQKKLHGSFRVT